MKAFVDLLLLLIYDHFWPPSGKKLNFRPDFGIKCSINPTMNYISKNPLIDFCELWIGRNVESLVCFGTREIEIETPTCNQNP